MGCGGARGKTGERISRISGGPIAVGEKGARGLRRKEERKCVCVRERDRGGEIEGRNKEVEAEVEVEERESGLARSRSFESTTKIALEYFDNNVSTRANFILSSDIPHSEANVLDSTVSTLKPRGEDEVNDNMVKSPGCGVK